MQHYAAFHLVFTVCKSTCLAVSRVQKVKPECAANQADLWSRFWCKPSSKSLMVRAVKALARLQALLSQLVIYVITTVINHTDS